MIIDKSYIEKRLEGCGYIPIFLDYFKAPHRYYHTLDHVIYILEKMEKDNNLNNDVLFLAAVFHDLIYDASAGYAENENLSIAAFRGLSNKILSETLIEEVITIIKDTSNHQATSKLSHTFQQYDLTILSEDILTLIDYEHKIFKEYQFLEYEIYKKGRINFLEPYNINKYPCIKELIEYIQWRKPSIGVYAGSFNPYHKGHRNILEKADKIFDKVILAIGHNPEKNKIIPSKILTYRQCDEYAGLLTDYLNSKSYEVTLIRGLRNSTDFQYEINQYRFLQDLMPNLKMVSIFCDKEFEHISSNALRILTPFKKDHFYLPLDYIF